MRFLFLAAVISTISTAGAVAEPGTVKTAALPEQNRCFCVQEIEDSTAPARVVRFTPPQPGCKKVKYKPGPKGTTPEENGLLNCDDLSACFKEERVLISKVKALQAKGRKAGEAANQCCANGSCDEKCLTGWQQASDAAGKDSLDLAVSEAKRTPCIPVTKQTSPDEELNTNIDGLMPQ